MREWREVRGMRKQWSVASGWWLVRSKTCHGFHGRHGLARNRDTPRYLFLSGDEWVSADVEAQWEIGGFCDADARGGHDARPWELAVVGDEEVGVGRGRVFSVVFIARGVERLSEASGAASQMF